MASNSKITLTIAGDATGVQRALKQTDEAAAQASTAVSKSSKHISESLEDVGRTAKGSKEIVRGLGDATAVMGGEMGLAAQNIGLTLMATRSLAKGTGSLIGSLGLLRVGLIGAALAGTAYVVSQEDGNGATGKLKTAVDDVNYALATNINFVTQGIPLIGSLTGKWKNHADVTSAAAHNADTLTSAESRLMYQFINTGNAAGYANKQIAAARAAQSAYGPYKTGYQFDTNNPGYQDLTYEAFMKGSAKIPKIGGGGGGSTAAKASTAAADALAATLSKWQGIADQFSNVAKGIADSLGPKLVAGIASPLMLAKGTSVLDNLKKQLADTIHLKKDLASLSKMGLDSGLLEQLTAGGLDSLPAADEILAGGESGIGAINKVAGKIGGNANSIAGADAARQFADSLKKPIKVELHVGKGGDDVLDKWLQKALKTKGAKFYGLKAA